MRFLVTCNLGSHHNVLLSPRPRHCWPFHLTPARTWLAFIATFACENLENYLTQRISLGLNSCFIKSRFAFAWGIHEFELDWVKDIDISVRTNMCNRTAQRHQELHTEHRVGKINATPPKNTFHKHLHKATHNTSNKFEIRVFKGTNPSKDVKKVIIYYSVVVSYIKRLSTGLIFSGCIIYRIPCGGKGQINGRWKTERKNHYAKWRSPSAIPPPYWAKTPKSTSNWRD